MIEIYDLNGGTEQCPCPCGAIVPVKKSNTPRNPDRLFASCERCDRFQWLDLPMCKCGERLYEGVCKKAGSPHRGRKFISCPNQCKKSFKWKSAARS